MKDDKNKGVRFALTFLLGPLGSFIINHSSLRPEGWKSRTLARIFLGILTLGIYNIVAAFSNFSFDPSKEKNIGFFKVEPEKPTKPTEN